MRSLSKEIKRLEGAVSIGTVQKCSLTATTLLYANSESSWFFFLTEETTLLLPHLRFSGGWNTELYTWLTFYGQNDKAQRKRCFLKLQTIWLKWLHTLRNLNVWSLLLCPCWVAGSSKCISLLNSYSFTSLPFVSVYDWSLHILAIWGQLPADELKLN